MRARNIKPGFFTDIDLAEKCCRDARLLFAGLWCLADCEGRMEDNIRWIRGELFRWDADMSQSRVEKLLRELAAGEFIHRYQVGGHRFIEVENFKKHQNPHPKEKAKGSSIPPRPGNGRVAEFPLPVAEKPRPDADGNGLVAEKVDTSRADVLNPDSLNPDSLNPRSAPTATHTTPDALIDSPDTENDSEKTVKPSPVTDPDWFDFRKAAENYGMQCSEIEWNQAYSWEWSKLDFTQRAAATKGITDRIEAQDFNLTASTPKNYLHDQKWLRAIFRPRRDNGMSRAGGSALVRRLAAQLKQGGAA